jgi:outer membrane murein-binding lipoprotein Lpp
VTNENGNGKQAARVLSWAGGVAAIVVGAVIIAEMRSNRANVRDIATVRAELHAVSDRLDTMDRDLKQGIYTRMAPETARDIATLNGRTEALGREVEELRGRTRALESK